MYENKRDVQSTMYDAHMYYADKKNITTMIYVRNKMRQNWNNVKIEIIYK